MLIVLGGLTMAGSLGSCSKAVPPAPDEFSSYEDCILGKLGRGQSKVASEAIIEACRMKFRPSTLPAPPVKHSTEAHRSAAEAGMVHDLAPENDEQKFGDFTCAGDCSGHKAGYNWAEEKGITDEGQCGGKSQSFVEGCKQWARDASDEWVSD
ncbi:hypothetical protein [Lysobacter olei]